MAMTIDEARVGANGPLVLCQEKHHPVLLIFGTARQLGAPTDEDGNGGLPITGWHCSRCQRFEFTVAFSGGAVPVGDASGNGTQVRTR